MVARQLRAGPSGPLVDIIDPDLVAAGRVVYVDQFTELPDELQTGSATQPFARLATAVSALTTTGGVIVIAPGDYFTEVLTPLTATEWTITNVDPHPNYPIGSIGPNNVVLPAITGSNLNIVGCRLRGALNVTTARLDSCWVEAPVSALSIDAFDCNFLSTAALTLSLGMTLVNCSLNSNVITALVACTIRLYDCFVFIALTITSPATSTLRVDQHTCAAFDAFIPSLTNTNLIIEGVSVGSARQIVLTPSGAVGVIDISALQPGGALVLQPTANANIDGFSTKQDGFWFDIIFDSAASVFVITFNYDIGATQTSIRTPQTAPLSIMRNTTLRVRKQFNRWRMNAIGTSSAALLPSLNNQAIPFIISSVFAAGGGGAADDVTVLAANLLPFNIRVMDAWLDTTTAVLAATGQLRSATGGGGNALSSAMSAAVANTTSRSSVGNTTGAAVAANGGIFLRRSDSGFSGEVFAMCIRS